MCIRDSSATPLVFQLLVSVGHITIGKSESFEFNRTAREKKNSDVPKDWSGWLAGVDFDFLVSRRQRAHRRSVDRRSGRSAVDVGRRRVRDKSSSRAKKTAPAAGVGLQRSFRTSTQGPTASLTLPPSLDLDSGTVCIASASTTYVAYIRHRMSVTQAENQTTSYGRRLVRPSLELLTDIYLVVVNVRKRS